MLTHTCRQGGSNVTPGGAAVPAVAAFSMKIAERQPIFADGR
jgi:hypothetical protein